MADTPSDTETPAVTTAPPRQISSWSELGVALETPDTYPTLSEVLEAAAFPANEERISINQEAREYLAHLLISPFATSATAELRKICGAIPNLVAGFSVGFAVALIRHSVTELGPAQNAAEYWEMITRLLSGDSDLSRRVWTNITDFLKRILETGNIHIRFFALHIPIMRFASRGMRRNIGVSLLPYCEKVVGVIRDGKQAPEVRLAALHWLSFFSFCAACEELFPKSDPLNIPWIRCHTYLHTPCGRRAQADFMRILMETQQAVQCMEIEAISNSGAVKSPGVLHIFDESLFIIMEETSKVVNFSELESPVLEGESLKFGVKKGGKFVCKCFGIPDPQRMLRRALRKVLETDAPPAAKRGSAPPPGKYARAKAME